MNHTRVAVIMAGGSGERFWPVSTKTRPKQFLNLTNPEISLLKEAATRAAGLVGSQNTFIATGLHLADMSQLESPESTILAEPAKRNTTGCLAWVAAHFISQNPESWSEITMAVLTADHRIAPQDGFYKTVNQAFETAETTGGLVTIGIRPDRPETGYGYIEVGEPIGLAKYANSFREKPNLETAQDYLSQGNYLWNSGMFFWTLPAFMSEMERAQPEISAAIREMAGHLKLGQKEAAVNVFEALPSISIDYALMEKASKVYVVEADFDWDDLGAWDSLKRSYVPDADGNVSKGECRTIETSNTVIYNETTDTEVCILGMDGIIAIVTDNKVMICPADRAQEVRKFSTQN